MQLVEPAHALPVFAAAEHAGIEKVSHTQSLALQAQLHGAPSGQLAPDEADVLQASSAATKTLARDAVMGELIASLLERGE